MGTFDPPHLVTRSLIDTIQAPKESDRQRWIRHLSSGCEPCWQTIRSGIVVRLPPPESEPLDPITSALNRLLVFHAPKTEGMTRAMVLRPLLPRHRHALRIAHDQPFGLLRLVLEESQAGLHNLARYATSPLALIQPAVDLVRQTDREPVEALYDLRAWTEAARARAAYLQEAGDERIRDHLQQALCHARRGAGDLLLSITLREIRSLPADIELEDRIAHLDQALDLLSAPEWDDLRAELLLLKAEHLRWQPEDAVHLCGQALRLLGSESPPRLRIEAPIDSPA